jgi:hypothetical protein
MTGLPCALPASGFRWFRGGLFLTSVFLAFLECTGPSLAGAQLQSRTLVAFDHYVQLTEARMKRDRDQPSKFLYIDSLPASVRRPILTEIYQGGIYLTELQTLDAAGHRLRTPDGWIHHWFAVMYVPGALLSEAVGVLQDYNHYKDFYTPDIIRSRILRHSDDDFLVYTRMQKETPWLTVTLDMDDQVHFFSAGRGRVYCISHSTRVMQVENAGRPDEHVDLPGQGGGYIWDMDSYWRLEQVAGGVIAEWESVAVSRTVPFTLRWLVRPFVRRAIRSTAQAMMVRTRQMIEARERARSHSQKPSP